MATRIVTDNVRASAPRSAGGGRPTVICLHSSASNGSQWAPLATRLADRFIVLTPNLCGYGPSSSQPHRALDLGQEVALLADLLDDQAAPVHLVGHSYGGAVALELARAWPEKIASLALFEPVPFSLLFGSPRYDSATREILGLHSQIQRHLQRGDTINAARAFVDYWSGTGTWQFIPAARQRKLAERMVTVDANFEALFAAEPDHFGENALNMPVMYLCGNVGPCPPRDIARVLLRKIRSVTARTFSGLGHMGPVTSPDLINSAIEEFLTI